MIGLGAPLRPVRGEFRGLSLFARSSGESRRSAVALGWVGAGRRDTWMYSVALSNRLNGRRSCGAAEGRAGLHRLDRGCLQSVTVDRHHCRAHTNSRSLPQLPPSHPRRLSTLLPPPLLLLLNPERFLLLLRPHLLFHAHDLFGRLWSSKLWWRQRRD